MRFLRWLRLWWHAPQGVWMIIHTSQPVFLECMIDEETGYIELQRWVRNPARATTFTKAEKAKVEAWNLLPEDARWYHVIEVPMFRERRSY